MMSLDFAVMDAETVGERLKAARARAQMTQDQVAQRVGVSRSVISQWETGLIQNIAAAHLAGCAKVLRVSLDWLLSGIDSEVCESEAPRYGADNAEELLRAWQMLTASQRAHYLDEILRAAAHNRDLLEELRDR